MLNRSSVLRRAQLPAPLVAIVATAGITHLQPLRPGSFGIVWVKNAPGVNQKLSQLTRDYKDGLRVAKGGSCFLDLSLSPSC